MGRFVVDSSFDNVLLIRYPRTPAQSDFEEMLSLLTKSFEPGKRFALLFDLDAFAPMSLTRRQRKFAAHFMRQQVPDFREHIVCEARITSSPIFWLLAGFFDWQAALPWPTGNFRARGKAVAWVQELMTTQNLRFPTDEVNGQLSDWSES